MSFATQSVTSSQPTKRIIFHTISSDHYDCSTAMRYLFLLAWRWKNGVISNAAVRWKMKDENRWCDDESTDDDISTNFYFSLTKSPLLGNINAKDRTRLSPLRPRLLPIVQMMILLLRPCFNIIHRRFPFFFSFFFWTTTTTTTVVIEKDILFGIISYRRRWNRLPVRNVFFTFFVSLIYILFLNNNGSYNWKNV